MTVDFRIPEIETDRLRLRLPRLSDLPAHVEFRTSARSQGVGGPFDEASCFPHLAGVVGQWQLRGYGRWMVADKITDEPCGIVGIYHPEDWPEPEIAWSIYGHAEGKGIAFEAAEASRRFAYETLGWTRIISLVLDDNPRSMALARRLGCTCGGVFDHPTFGEMNIWRHQSPQELAAAS